MATATRRCLACGYSGQMKSWLSNYNFPQLLAIIGLLLYFIPGLIFIAWGWGKFKCPNCGALAKNTPDLGAAAPVTSIVTKDHTKRSFPGYLTGFVAYALALTAMYFATTPEVTGNFTEGQERDFHVAAVRLKNDANDANYVAYSLAQLKAGKVDLASVSFLLPQDSINIPGGDIHKVTVLERHPDWQLVEYHYGNTHDSISRYRAFKDRIEPVSYRITMHVGLVFGAMVLLIPAWIISALVNAIWNAVARRKKSSEVA